MVQALSCNSSPLEVGEEAGLCLLGVCVPIKERANRMLRRAPREHSDIRNIAPLPVERSDRDFLR
jgi:hypothetical protein